MSKLPRHHRLLWMVLSVQLLAVLIGLGILYTCASGGIPPHNLSETAFWGTIGILRFMFMGMIVPLTFLVVIVMFALLWCGSIWRKVRFLSWMALVLWGVYWIFVSYTVCAPPPD
jgi:hypothetical protein